jgi:hypothetical protein
MVLRAVTQLSSLKLKWQTYDSGLFYGIHRGVSEVSLTSSINFLDLRTLSRVQLVFTNRASSMTIRKRLS